MRKLTDVERKKESCRKEPEVRKQNVVEKMRNWERRKYCGEENQEIRNSGER